MLNIAGTLSLLIALLHGVMIVIGAEAYRYFAAGQKMVDMALAGSPIPALITFLITVVFTVFAMYAFSGTGVIRELPLLKPAIWVIGAIYALRGLAIFVQFYLIVQGQTGENLATKDVIFSCVALFVGIVYLLGAYFLPSTE